MSGQGSSTDYDVVVHVDFNDAGLPVGRGRNRLVQAIASQVTHVTFLVFAFLGLSTKKKGRVEQLWLRFKDQWKLHDRDSTKKWFNATTNARWKDHRTKVLKKNYDRAPDLATAKANRPEGMISSSTWEELCDQFFSISDSSGDSKSKSDKCRGSRMKIPTDHHWGRTSISGWSHEHLQKFGKAPTMVNKYKKGYMCIDPLMSFVESGSSTEEGERAEPYTGIGTPEQRAIGEDLERVYEECISDGKDQSTADSIACERVLGKTKVLGIQSSTTKKVARSRFSSVNK